MILSVGVIFGDVSIQKKPVAILIFNRVVFYSIPSVQLFFGNNED